MMDQGLQLSIWLGGAALTLVSAQIMLWHTRRVLDHSRPALAPGVKLVPAAVKVKIVPPAAVAESAGAAIAS
jgi:hypothetical protein